MGIGMAILYLVPKIYRVLAQFVKHQTGVDLPGAGLVDKIEKGKEKLRNSLESNLDQAEQKAVNVVVNLTQPSKEAQEPAQEVKIIETEAEEAEPKKLSTKKPRKKKTSD
jgi:hypothetical protein